MVESKLQLLIGSLWPVELNLEKATTFKVSLWLAKLRQHYLECVWVYNQNLGGTWSSRLVSQWFFVGGERIEGCCDWCERGLGEKHLGTVVMLPWIWRWYQGVFCHGYHNFIWPEGGFVNGMPWDVSHLRDLAWWQLLMQIWRRLSREWIVWSSLGFAVLGRMCKWILSCWRTCLPLFRRTTVTLSW